MKHLYTFFGILFAISILYYLYIQNISMNHNKSNVEKKSVIVVWAGMAGLIAAKDLQSFWFDVVVLEASARIWGRLFTTALSSGTTVDLWASRIHGIRNNPIKTLIDDNAITTTMTDYDNRVIYQNQTQIPEKVINRWEQLYEKFRDYVEEESDTTQDTGLDIYVYDYMQQLKKEDRKIFLHTIQNETTNDIAADPAQISTLDILKQSDLQGDDAFVHGYMQLATNIASWLNIITGSHVHTIDYQGTGVIVSYNTGKNMYADYVIVTVPLGVLQKKIITFVPWLPTDKIHAIDGLAMWVLNKTFLEFDTVFWDKNQDIIGYTDHPQWARSFWVNVYKYVNKPILLWLNGWSYATQLESKTDQEIVAEAMKSLTSMYGKHIPQPTHYAISRRSVDKNSYGAYSFVPVWATDMYYDVLAESVYDKIFFAWEATHKKHHSTVLGAYLSGKREAKKIYDLGQ